MKSTELPDKWPEAISPAGAYHPNDLLTPKQTAKVLLVTEGTLSVWRSTGRYQLPFVKVGRWVRYRWSDVLAFIERRTQHQVP
ncbi:helix-turn-helix domain-containing protein [Endozoicomonadaceae bacterium StTr2]